MQAAKKETVFEFPEGGIADFYMTDEQFAELERREEVGHGGIANVHHIADRIAEYGRYGDDTLAHVETGELIVPKALLEKNPALKESILEHLEELGVEDPERYIVGSEFNSLNPDTQLPEFFFKKIFKKAKKAFKKVVKGVKKTLKKIGKVLKKASAVVLPVVLNAVFPGMGAIMTGALSGGISTLLQGGDLKDALKGAALGGLTGAVVKGGYNKLTGKSGFLDTIKTEVTDLGNLKSQFSTTGGILDPARYTAAPAAAAPAAGAQAAPVTQAPLPEIQGPPVASEAALIGEPTFAEQVASTAEGLDPATIEALADPNAVSMTDAGLDVRIGGQPVNLVPTTPDGTSIIEATAQRTAPPMSVPGAPQMSVPGAPPMSVPGAPQMSVAPLGGPPTAATAQRALELDALRAGAQGAGSAAGSAATGNLANVVKQIEPPGFFESVKGAFMPGDDVGFVEGLQTAFAPGSTLPSASELTGAPYNLSLADAQQAVKDATPGMIRTYGPSLAAAGLAAQQMGAFEVPTYDPVTLVELEQSMGGKTAEELIAMDPSKYRIDNLGRPVIISNPLVPSTTAPPMTTMPGETPQYYRQGGQAFPRRTGGIDPSEGVPNQDSVRAMLMPGEFVMTTKAVRGMSRNGDSREGIRNMYSMMRNLEARERKMG